MNDLDKYQARKIRKRIEIKQSNLKILLPEINFLQFIEELEQFQQTIEGVDTDGPAPQVQLPLARSRFESLQKSYKSLLNFLTDSSESIKQRSNDILLKQLSEAVDESTLFLTNNFRNFQSHIESSSSLLYNLKAILIIRDLLTELQSEVNIVKSNFYNIGKSTTKLQVKNTLTSIYAAALASTSLKFERLSRSFPKFSKPSDLKIRFKRFSVDMAENISQTAVVEDDDKFIKGGEAKDAKKDELIPQEIIEDVPDEHDETEAAKESSEGNDRRQVAGEVSYEKTDFVREETDIIREETDIDREETDLAHEGMKSDHEEAGIRQEAGEMTHEDVKLHTETDQQQPTTIEGQSKKDTLSVDKGKKPEIFDNEGGLSMPKFSGLLTASLTSSLVNLKEELQAELDRQRKEIDQSLLELSDLESKIKEISKAMEQHRRSFKVEIEEIEKLKRRISDDTEITEEERVKKLQDYAVQIGQMSGLNEERLQELETQKNEYKTRSLAIAGKLYDIKKNLDVKMQELLETLHSAHSETMTEAEKQRIERARQTVERMYSEELNIFETIDEIDNFQVDDHGVFYYDKTNIKTYITTIGLAKMLDKNIGLSLEEAEVKEEESSHASTAEQSASKGPMSTTHSRKSASRSRPCSLAGTSGTSDEKVRGQLPVDSENYIKNTLGKPLRQALAAITIYQPSDPINYLANYLLQYRYNELRNIQRHQDFENLVIERERYAKSVQLEKRRQEMQQRQQCDPCNPPPTAKF